MSTETKECCDCGVMFFGEKEQCKKCEDMDLLKAALVKIRDRYAGEYGGHISEAEMRQIAREVLEKTQ